MWLKKQYFFLGFILFFPALGVHAQLWQGLHGPVKKSKVAEYDFKDDGTVDYDRKYYNDEFNEYNRLGKHLLYGHKNTKPWEKEEREEMFYVNDSVLTKEFTYENDTLVSIKEYFYDERGRESYMTEKRINGTDTTLGDEWAVVYDSLDMKVEHHNCEEGKFTRKTVLTYNQNHKMTSMWYYTANGLSSVVKYVLDTNGNDVAIIETDGEGNIKSTTRNWYNEKGQRIKSVEYTNGKPDRETTYRYHPNGRMAAELRYFYPGKFISTGMFDSGKSVKRKASRYDQYYDEHGNIIKTESSEITGNNYTWEYTYDRYGSWTTQKWYTKGRPWIYKEQTIEYYDE